MKCVPRKWKYNSKVFQHWVDFEEGGTLANETKNTRREEEQRASSNSEPLKGKKLSSLPARLEADDEAPLEHQEEGDGQTDHEQPAELEKEDPCSSLC